MYTRFFKRLFDVLFSFLALLILFPVILLITITLFIFNKSKPFFFQPRPGKHGRIFYVLKFKTMNDKTDKSGELLPPIRRITAVGRFLRATSLDELPQLWNVLRGDMSLIGPRPLRVEYLPLYSKEQARRHEVRPGITGWAQVNGRNTISWEEKFKYDVWYVDNLTIGLDIKIFFLTIKKVFVREGINEGEDLTMEPFRGTKTN